MNDINSTVNRKDDFVSLGHFIKENALFIDRMAVFMNNVGVGCLLDNAYDEAEEWFRTAQNCSGQTIHHIGVNMNLLALRYLDGDIISSDEAIKFFRYMKRANLPRQYDYHQSYLFWNLLVTSDHNPLVESVIFSHLKDKMFLPYESVLRKEISMVDFLVDYIGSARKAGRFLGPRGEFIHRVGLFPVIHYAWM